MERTQHMWRIVTRCTVLGLASCACGTSSSEGDDSLDPDIAGDCGGGACDAGEDGVAEGTAAADQEK